MRQLDFTTFATHPFLVKTKAGAYLGVFRTSEMIGGMAVGVVR